jgi:hypothetical protein
MNNNQSWHDSLCIEHKTKLDDSVTRPVTACAYCGRDMCSFHLRPTLIKIPDFNPKSKRQSEIAVIIETSHKGGDGHPCMLYTVWFWKQYDEDKEKSIKALERSMNNMKYGGSTIETKPQQQPTPPPTIVKYCPKCGTFMQSSTFFCPICGERQEKPVVSPTTSPKEPPTLPSNKLKEFLKDLFGWR